MPENQIGFTFIIGKFFVSNTKLTYKLAKYFYCFFQFIRLSGLFL